MSDVFADAAVTNEGLQIQFIAQLLCLECGKNISEEPDTETEINSNAVAVHGKCAGCGTEYSLTLMHD